MNIVSFNELKYQRYAKAVGMMDLRNDTQVVHKVINKNLRKEYIKSYIKLLSK